jgi:acyl-CoA dehydrogenase
LTSTLLSLPHSGAKGDKEFGTLLGKVHDLGRTVLAPAAGAVDREARFPVESFDALKAEKLLSCYVPVEYGGMGLNVVQVSRICEALGQYCASTAMVFAMHQIQVAMLVHHALSVTFFRDYARELVAKQLLLASATTELGVGGDVRSSICAARVVDDHFILEKNAPVISYGEAADAILVTSRRAEDAAKNDQVITLVRKEDVLLRRLSEWDTLGFRGTCSPGFELKSMGNAQQILPVPTPTSTRGRCTRSRTWSGLRCGRASLPMRWQRRATSCATRRARAPASFRSTQPASPRPTSSSTT